MKQSALSLLKVKTCTQLKLFNYVNFYPPLQSNRCGRLRSLTFGTPDDESRKGFRKAVFSANHNILKQIQYECFLSNTTVHKVRFLP
jgi:hypothetical protein